MKVLHLTLKKKWFDLICSGEKVFEYREYKQHWIKRLLGRSGPVCFDEIIFTNGYGHHRPRVRCEHIGTAIIDGKYCEPCHGEPLEDGKKYFVVGLGKILERVNVDTQQSVLLTR